MVAHHKIKPATVLDYKYSVERSDQMLSHYTFERKTKLWRKCFFHLLDLVVVNAHIFITNQARKIRRWKFSMKKSPKGVLLPTDGTEMQVQGPAGRLVGRDYSIYSIPATHAKLAGKSQHSFLASAEEAPGRESCEDVLQCSVENAM
jgi:hypothetical protein